MLLRIDDSDAGTATTIEACAKAVSELAARGLVAMVEPLPYERDADGTLFLRKDAPALSRAVTIASGLGTTSAYTWLKMPACDDYETVFGSTTLPCVVLGGVPERRPGRRPRVVGRDALAPGRARPRRRPDPALPARMATSVRRCTPRPRCSTRPSGWADVTIHRPFTGVRRRGRRARVADPRGRRLGVDRAARRAPVPGRDRAGGDRPERAASCCRCAGRCGSRSPTQDEPGDDRGEVRPRRPGQRVQRGHRLRLRRPRQRGHAARPTSVAEVALPASRCSTRLEAAVRRRGRRAGGDPRGRPGEPPGQQLRRARCLGPRREADRRRADHAARQLVELPAAQARRLRAVRGGQRGDLLLPDRRGRPGHAVARRPRLPPHLHRPRARRGRSRRRSTRPSRCATTTSC